MTYLIQQPEKEPKRPHEPHVFIQIRLNDPRMYRVHSQVNPFLHQASIQILRGHDLHQFRRHVGHCFAVHLAKRKNFEHTKNPGVWKDLLSMQFADSRLVNVFKVDPASTMRGRGDVHNPTRLSGTPTPNQFWEKDISKEEVTQVIYLKLGFITVHRKAVRGEHDSS